MHTKQSKMNILNGKLSWKARLALCLTSAALLSLGWATISGFTLLVALVPLLIVSSSFSSSWADSGKMALWALLTFILWHIAGTWWVWNAAPIGTIAASLVGSWWCLLPFMLFHIVSKRMPKGVAYILLTTAWMACEYIYIKAPAMSFPWLTLGNGFAFDTWAVQWYEYTGVLGGSLWVLATNIAIFEALKTKRWVTPALVVILPLILSVILYSANSPKRERYNSRKEVKVASIQPNVDCYTKFLIGRETLQQNLMQQLTQAPKDADFILMPETALSATVNERFIAATRIVQGISTHLKINHSNAMVVTGTESLMAYGKRRKSDTNRRAKDGSYYDIFNSSIGITSDPFDLPIHNKCKLVIGVETLPAWFRAGGIFQVDLGGTAGQLGIGQSAEPFAHNDIKIAPAICYEGLYGDFMGEFVRNGAQIFSVVSNDGWWGDTPGYKYLFAYCRLRAIEHRRDIARSANTGISGFINSRGDALQMLEWDKKGVITHTLRANDHQTFYTRHGDYIGRLSLYVALLCLLYTIAILSKKRFYLD